MVKGSMPTSRPHHNRGANIRLAQIICRIIDYLKRNALCLHYYKIDGVGMVVIG